MRLNLNLADELVEKLDNYANENYITRTSAICVLLTNALKANDVNKGISSLNKIVDLLGSSDEN